MKHQYLLLLGLMCIYTSVNAQKRHSLSLGYFGETLTYPGIVLEYDREAVQSEKISLVSRSDIGYYNHMRNHQAFFVDQHLGLRRNIGSHWFVEHYVGLGVMLPILNAPVYRVNEDGIVEEGNKVLNPDLMPSVTLGIGYAMKEINEKKAIWLRPKMFWQYPYNTLPLPHVAIQIGYTQTLKQK